ncbi:hypothetical protein C8F01DRAFT_1360536 [Mycena amicta]|nr:hypothetical protein C8F01DRAFT_1360536 [Mycena amicta]
MSTATQKPDENDVLAVLNAYFSPTKAPIGELEDQLDSQAMVSRSVRSADEYEYEVLQLPVDSDADDVVGPGIPSAAASDRAESSSDESSLKELKEELADAKQQIAELQREKESLLHINATRVAEREADLSTLRLEYQLVREELNFLQAQLVQNRMDPQLQKEISDLEATVKVLHEVNAVNNQKVKTLPPSIYSESPKQTKKGKKGKGRGSATKTDVAKPL